MKNLWTNLKRPVRWVLINGAFLGLLLLAVLEDMTWAGNLVVFGAWVNLALEIFCTVVVIAALSMVKVADTLEATIGEDLKLDPDAPPPPDVSKLLETFIKLEPSVPQWLDLSYDALIITLMVVIGWIPTALAYAASTGLQTLYRKGVKWAREEHWRRIEKAVKA